jgi:thiamine transport system ATP-binding protein
VSIVVDGVSVAIDGRRILDDVRLATGTGETVAVVGPSGSGKSTLLRVIAGLQPPAGGRVLVGGDDVTALPAHRRGVGLMFQDDALFPHRDVRGNVAFGLRMEGAERAAIDARVAELLTLVGLAGTERRSVRTLSGGERKRVALARALAPSPRALLLDEPLGALDRPLRERLLRELAAIFEAVQVTSILVTHDVAEAFALADRVVVLREGRIVQAATPEELWQAPASAWVARFLGIENVTTLDGRATVIRPEAIIVTAAPAGASSATVEAATRSGPLVRLTVRIDDGQTLHAVTTALDHPRPGDRADVTIDAAGVIEIPEE